MTKHHGFKHDLFGKLLGFRLHHQHGVLRAGDHEVEGRQRLLFLGGVQNELAINVANARRTDRTHEGNAGERERCRRGNKCGNVGIVFEIVGHDRGNDLRFQTEAIGEQRADRAVDQARDQCFAFRSGGLRA